MMVSADSPTLKETAGSRIRCLLLTGLPRTDTARILTDLTDGNAVVMPDHEWLPNGILKPQEAMVHGTFPLISNLQRQELIDWWLHTPKGANTPNWDIVSTCLVGERKGLLLVEAKAHEAELKIEGKGNGNQDNHSRIDLAIQNANTHLNTVLPGWNLQRDHHYQLANRFAWAWKLASMEIPIVLVYLGFRNAEEMKGKLFVTHGDWKTCVLKHSLGIVPPNAWGQQLKIGSNPETPPVSTDKVAGTGISTLKSTVVRFSERNRGIA